MVNYTMKCTFWGWQNGKWSEATLVFYNPFQMAISSSKAYPIWAFLIALCWNWSSASSFTELSGQWKFIAGKLLIPQDFSLAASKTVQVPGYWDYGGEPNVGTYQREIALPPSHKTRALRIPEQALAYKLWVNDSLMATKGVVSLNPEQIVPAMGDQIIMLPRDSICKITLQIASNDSERGGFSAALEMGDPDELQGKRNQLLIIDALVVGALLILALYQLILYLHNPRQAYLALALLCVVWALSFFAGGTGGRLSLAFFPGLTYEVLIKLEVLSLVTLAPLVLLFVRDSFLGVVPRWFLYGVGVLSGLTTLLILVFPFSTWVWIVTPWQLFSFALTIPGFIKLGKAIKRGVSGGVPLVLGFITLELTGINDVLYDMRLIQTGYYLQYAILFLVLSFAYVLSKHYAESYNALEENQDLKRTIDKQSEYLRQVSMARRHLEQILNAVQEPLFVFREDGEILYSNKPCIDLMGHADGQKQARLCDWLFPGIEQNILPETVQDILFQHANGEKVELCVNSRALFVGEDSFTLCLLSQETTKQTQEILAAANRKKERSEIGELLEQAYSMQREQSHSRLARILRTLEEGYDELRKLVQPRDEQTQKMARLGSELLRDTIDLWCQAYPDKSKVELARESGIWSVYMNRDGWERTQTLDRYLSEKTFPEQPRWSKVIETVEFVLAGPNIRELEARKKVEADLKILQAQLQEG